MKRKDIIEKLLSEGFTEKTLSRMSDNELNTISRSLFSEEVVMISNKNPKASQEIATAKKSGKTIETYESEISEEEECDECQQKKSKEKKDTKKWIEKLAEDNFHSFTSKNEIMEIINRMTEQETLTPMPKTKPKKGHNGIPEFMTYDEITSSGTETKPAPTKPKVDPDTKPKPRTPYQPGPGTDPKPKAIKEEK